VELLAMSDSISFTVHDAGSAREWWRDQFVPFARRMWAAGVRSIRITLEAGDGRSLPQNARLHARLTEIAERHQWAGQKRDAEVWKRLLTAAWLRARGESVEILPAIDGHGVDVVFRRTSKLTRAECAELMEFIDAWEATL
jgi:hypothetical protein